LLQHLISLLNIGISVPVHTKNQKGNQRELTHAGVKSLSVS